jgi:adenylate cyclase
MAEEGFKRKLSAILSADVVGYSRLMGEDEETTVQTLTTYRDIITNLIEAQNGRVADAKGDNILAEFVSVVDAVRCAVEIQRELKKRNSELADHRKMEFRIGINLGDIIEEEETIYGDGVNIAARLEALAHPGEICISGTVYDHVRNKLDFGYEYLGEQTVKNIPESVRVYRVLIDPEAAGRVIGEKRFLGKISHRAAITAFIILIVVAGGLAGWNLYLRQSKRVEPAYLDRMAFPLPNKPSIAVLPFVNMSDDPKQEFFSDGLTDQIISTISKLQNLFVIARNSTFTYKGKPVKVQKVAEDLGVKYVLEGSVQRTTDRIRITVQLIDATTGGHVWSERYDREPKDIFAIHDDITMEITKALRIELISGEQARLWQQRMTTNLGAYEKFLQGINYFFRGTKADNTRARQLCEEAIALDSEYAGAYSILGWTHWADARYGWIESPPESIKMAFKYAQKAIEIDDSLDHAHTLIGGVYFLRHQYEKAMAEAERAIALNPNGANNYSFMAGLIGCMGRWEDGIEFSRKAIRLEPFPPVFYFHWLGRAYFMTEQYDKAIATWKKALRVGPNYLPAHAFLAACYSSLDRHAEATAAAKEVLRINPKFSLESYAKTLPYKNKVDIKRYVSALRKAGLPDTLPLPIPDKPSIAVLAFENMSGDPEQEYFSDGLSEEIITALSKTPRLFVIARNSSFTYKGKPVKIQQVGRELGVKYVLEGSVRKSGERVRITAQLVDAKTGKHLWAERYDRDLKDLFALQDEITLSIIRAMRVELTEGEQASVTGKGTENLDAYLKSLQAHEQFYLMNKEGSMRAKQLVKEAIALDPKYAFPYTTLANAHMLDVWFKFSASPKDSMRLAVEAAQKALTLDASDPRIHYALTNLYIMQRQYEKAIDSAERAVELSPSGARAFGSLGTALSFACRFNKAIQSLEQAIRLNPYPPGVHFRMLGGAYRGAGRYEEAVTEYKKALRQNPDDIFAHLGLAVTYIKLGREEEARAEAKEVIRIHPKFSVDYFAKVYHLKDQSIVDDSLACLRKAGLPE